MRSRVAVLAAVSMLLLFPHSAQPQLTKLRNKVKAKVEQKVDQKVDQKIEETIDCLVGDSACIEKAHAEGKTVVLKDAQGNTVAVDSTGAGAGAAGSAAAEAKPGEGAWENYDFVPGEKVLFADDFSTDRVGDFPRRLKFIDGNVEVVQWQERQWLSLNSDADFAVDLAAPLPERFTMELEMTLPWLGALRIWAEPPTATTTDPGPHAYINADATAVGIQRGGQQVSQTDPRAVIPDLIPPGSKDNLSRPVHVRVQADGGYMKVYVEEHRVANAPQTDFQRGSRIHFHYSGSSKALLGAFSINEGGRSLYDALAADGRVATQGIYFDTGSEKIRPESTPTLKEIGEMLKAHPDLKLSIEGHTDNVGSAAANQALSERRAAAVRQYLIDTFGIDAARLQSKGFGASKPVASNDTPEGRQNNRRVELVKG